MFERATFNHSSVSIHSFLISTAFILLASKRNRKMKDRSTYEWSVRHPLGFFSIVPTFRFHTFRVSTFWLLSTFVTFARRDPSSSLSFLKIKLILILFEQTNSRSIYRLVLIPNTERSRLCGSGNCSATMYFANGRSSGTRPSQRLCR